MANDNGVHLFGIRHHGPGCARSLAQALDALQPDCILVEGPPEGDDLIPFVADEAMQPPLALLVYAPAAPQHAVFYPYAEFSPEWQALRHACARQVPVRFCDLAQAHRLQRGEGDGEEGAEGEDGADGERTPVSRRRADPLAWLAQAAGYSDSETWWDHLVEQRADSLDLFAAIAEMMTVARAAAGEPLTPLEARREAAMRTAIRQAQKQGYQRIAVVCGAWHVPALATMPSAKSDADLLKGLPKTKTAATWTPWSYGRLAFHSGYGAGVEAPGWYRHLWAHPEQAGLRWLTQVASLLRSHDLDASPAQAIEAARLADALAALRDRPRAGLAELQEAVRAVFCHDSDAPLQLIRSALLVDDRLGSVPPGVPMLPLPQDVAAQQKRLRMPVRADTTALQLDLREPAHLEKSILLHRLALLGVPWGASDWSRGKTGTFNEGWRLAWEPEFAVRLIEANVWGGTVLQAATAYALDRAARATTLPELTALIGQVLLADLPGAVDGVMARLQEVSALTPDLGFMLEALPPLANVLRYGNVRDHARRAADEAGVGDTADGASAPAAAGGAREADAADGTDAAGAMDAITAVVDGLVARICIALPLGARGLADDAAADLLKRLVAADQAIRLVQRGDYLEQWFNALAQAAQGPVHALVAGRCTRILAEQGHWNMARAADGLALQCSHGVAPLAAAHWLEGFLQGGGALLLHHDRLWELVSAWLGALPPDAFIELLPLLRRTFGAFAAPERRALGERAAGADGNTAHAPAAAAADEARALRILPVLGTILGIAEVAHG